VDIVGGFFSQRCLQGCLHGLRCSVLLLLAGTAFASGLTEIQGHLENDYLGNYFVIRCLCSGDDLGYDMAGHVIKGDQTPESWTVAEVQITKLDLHEKNLEIRGQRAALVYDAATKRFQRERRLKLRANERGTDLQKVRIVIQAGKEASEEDWRNTLAAVFTSEDQVSYLDGVPEFWRIYLQSQDSPLPQTQHPRADDSSISSGSTTGGNNDRDQLTAPPLKVGAGVSAPKPLFTPDPAYANAARASKVRGTVVLWMVVDAEGIPRKIRLVSPLGFGLDEMAVHAVERWRFKPAERDGVPVAVQMNVQASFRMY